MPCSQHKSLEQYFTNDVLSEQPWYGETPAMNPADDWTDAILGFAALPPSSLYDRASLR
jgi:hypothetical protein